MKKRGWRKKERRYNVTSKICARRSHSYRISLHLASDARYTSRTNEPLNEILHDISISLVLTHYRYCVIAIFSSIQYSQQSRRSQIHYSFLDTIRHVWDMHFYFNSNLVFSNHLVHCWLSFHFFDVFFYIFEFIFVWRKMICHYSRQLSTFSQIESNFREICSYKYSFFTFKNKNIKLYTISTFYNLNVLCNSI